MENAETGDAEAAGVQTGEEAGTEAEARAAIRDCAILVVDDTAFNRALILALLEEAGFHNVSCAESGREALDRIAAAPPDLLILDIMMPGMDGFEVCRRLRADPDHADLPILVQTALSSSDDRNRAFAAGTTDLVSKPLDRTELLARVVIQLESRVLIRRLQGYRARVEGELAIAQSMREHLLPSPALCDSLGAAAGVTLRSHTATSASPGADPGANLCGDLWGVLRLDGPRFGIFLLDMGGSGVSAAMNAFRMHTLLHELAPDHGGDPAGLLAALNGRALDLLEPGQRASVLYGVVEGGGDGEAGRFVYAAAAAPPPLLFAPEGGAPQSGAQPCGGPLPGGAVDSAIGTPATTRYEARTLALAPGAVLALGSADLLGTLEAGGGDGLAALIDRATAGEDGHTLLWIERSAAA